MRCVEKTSPHFSLYYLYANTKDILLKVENRLDISLKEYVSVVQESRNIEYGEEHIEMKLLIHEEKTENVKQELDTFFKVRRQVEENIFLPQFENTCPWWDLNFNDIKLYYSKMEEGKRAKTVEIWAFISRVDGKDYLYIAY